MSHPLVWLMWRDTRSATLGLLRRLRQPRGALTLASLLLFGAVVGFSMRSTGSVGSDVRTFGSPGLTMLVLLGAFSPLGLYFRPADVHWLLTAPLSRTALVLYNVAIRARPAFMSGLLLSLLPNWRGEGWWQAFTGYSLIFLLLQISAQWMAVVRAWLALYLRTAWRRALGVALFGLPIAAVALELQLRSEEGLLTFLVESRALAFIGAPTRPFLAVVVAPDLAAWGQQAAIALAILAVLVAHICWLRVPYRQAAIQQSERRTRRFARMRSGGGAFGGGPSGSARRLPMPPHLGGAGPVAWRQAQELVRNPRGIAMLLTIVSLVVVVVVGVPWLIEGDSDLTDRMGFTGIFLVTFLPLVMGDNIACDFRRDLDRMGQLKSWPIAPLALATGQIAPAALFVTAVQMLGVAIVVAATGAVSVGVALLVLSILPVVSWVALSLDNLLFLWLPYRTVPEDPGDVAFVGRTFATALFKLATLAAILGVSFALGRVAFQATGTLVAAIGVPVAGLLVACAGGTVAVGRAFARYDIARHSPV